MEKPNFTNAKVSMAIWKHGVSVSAFNMDEEELYVLAGEKPSGGGQLPSNAFNMHFI